MRVWEWINVGIWGDGGCCGCNETKRRIFFVATGIVMGIIAAYFWYEDQPDTAYALIAGAILFGLAGLLCPNGCCNEYKRTGYEEA